MRLLLIRHGQTPANVDGVLDTATPGPGLTPLGREQAAALPAALAPIRIDRMAVSSLRRTAETAGPLAAAAKLMPVEHPGLGEIEAGELEGRNDRAAVDQYLATAAAWIRGDRAARMPGGTDGHAFFARFDEAVASVTAGGASTVVVVSHGAAIRVWAGAIARNASAAVAVQPLENTGIVELDGTPGGGWELLRWASAPAGGAAFIDRGAPDPTGERI
ncbi:histidine phosphatase family protein [Curtobacterium ammoniigenes]|uniref:histidine phosphatase family protein n=1 Tax=Curtobacterium ammoniigenes TaxID=395387 RepID=UPI000834343D|nr:histidine phosphatase family protein [Curtobacterium ammoniigenes]